MSSPTPVNGAASEFEPGNQTESGAAADAPQFIELGAPGEPVTLPGGDDPLKGEFAREGFDLQIELPGGETLVVVDYFAGGPDAMATLVTENGGRLLPETVAKLAGPQAPDQVAQSDGTATDAAPGAALGEPVGAIDAVKGTATVIRADGTEETLEAGTPIYENDTIVTGAESALGVLFVDDSTMSMGGGARIVVDQMVYDDSSQTGSQAFDAIQGAFVFASGHIGKSNPDDVEVRTPVATIGIRGTKYGINVGAEGGDTTVTLFEGAVAVGNDGGETVLSSVGQTTRIGSFFDRPGDVEMMDPITQATTYGDAIAYSPDQPSLESSGEGNNDPNDDGNGDQAVLDESDLERLADQLNEIDAAAGPSGAIGAITISGAFLRLLNGLLEGSGITSGTLANDNTEGGAGDDGVFGENQSTTPPLTDDPPFEATGPPAPQPVSSVSWDPSKGLVDSFVAPSSSDPNSIDEFVFDASASTGSTNWSISQNSDGDVVIREGENANSDDAEIEEGDTNVTLDEFEELNLGLGSGNDTVAVGNLSNTDIVQDTVTITGGAGDDAIDASETAKHMVIEGGDGDDNIQGGSYDDDLFGDAGDDVIQGNAGGDTIKGGAGNDTIYGESASASDSAPLLLAVPEAITTADGSYTTTVSGLPEGVTLTDGEGNVHEGTSFTQEELSNLSVIVPAGTPSFTVSFSAVQDGAPSADPIDGQTTVSFDDDIDGGEGDDVIYGGRGEDTIDGGEGDDVIIGGAGADTILYTVGQGADEITGGAGSDTLTISFSASDLEDSAIAADMLALTNGERGTFDGLGITVNDDVETVTFEGEFPAPDVSVSLAVGDAVEDEPTDLSIDIAGADSPLIEASVTLSGLPEGYMLTNAAGDSFAGGAITLSVDQLDGLQVTAPDNASGNIALSVSVTATHAITGATDSTGDSGTLSILADADAPSLSVEAASTLEGLAGDDILTAGDGGEQLTGGAGEDVLTGGDGDDVLTGDGANTSVSVALSITAGESDDASETLTVTLTGLPEGVVLTDGDGNVHDGTTFTQAELDDLHALVPAGTGDFDITVTATSTDGDDSESVSETLTVAIDDGSAGGNDDVLIGGAGADTLIGGEGDDTLSLTLDPEAGQDVADGGSGLDSLTLTVGPLDLLDPDVVADIIDLADFIASGPDADEERTFDALNLKVTGIDSLTVVDLDGTEVSIDALRDQGFTIIGDDSDEALIGSDNADIIEGGEGDDVIDGGGGDDTIDGGAGSDTIFGGAGDDVILGSDQADIIYGGTGDDDITGGGGDDTIDGGAGDDVIDGGTGNDVIDGGTGDDQIIGGTGDDDITGGEGDDSVTTGGGSDTVDAGAGDDTVTYGYSAGDSAVLDGGAGHDTLRIELSSGLETLEQTLEEVAAAIKAAKEDSDAQQTVDSLGLAFENFEDVELYVDGEQQLFATEITGLEPLDIDTDALFAGVQIARNVAIEDADSPTLMQATIEIGNAQDGDELTIEQSVLDAAGLTAETTEDGALVLSGDAPIAAYEEAIAAIRLVNDDPAPEIGTREISVSVTDDDGISTTADPIAVGVVAATASIADADGADNDTVAYVSEAGSDGAVVDDMTEAGDGPGETTTETLTISVARHGVGAGGGNNDDDHPGQGSNGQFTVTVNGLAIGIFTAAAVFGEDGWGTIDIPGIPVTEGDTLDIKIEALNPASNVLVDKIEFGDMVFEAETDNIGLTGTEHVEDGYVSLANGGSVEFKVAVAGPEGDAFDTWLLSTSGGDEALDEADLGQLFDGVDMGDGIDWVAAADGVANALEIDLGGDVWTGAEHVFGGAGDDTITGNDQANILAGGAGDDVITAGSSDDLLLGGDGDDTLAVTGDDLSAMGGEQDFGDTPAAMANALGDDLSGKSGIDGGSGNDTLKLTAGPSDGTLGGEDMEAVSGIEALDIGQTGDSVDVNLSVDDIVEMTDDDNELTILKGQDDTVTIDGQERHVGDSFELPFDGDTIKITIAESETPPDSG